MSETAQPAEFTCALCGVTFEPDWSQEEAAAEAAALWGAPDNVMNDPDAAGYTVVCDPCFQRMIAEYPPEQFFADMRLAN